MSLASLLRGSIAALHGLGTSITRDAHELHRNIRCHSIAYLQDMWLRHNLKVSLHRNAQGSFSQSFRSVRLALKPLATADQGSPK